ncbi:MAG TPA: hypothetical protein VED41_06430, partial [Solirubrobacteraceae bacterium]|nr:hypothetical protein [Solirubrobacteraceae bacterium]
MTSTALEEVWRVLTGTGAAAFEMTGAARFPASPYALDEIAVAAVGAALVAAAELAQARGGHRPQVTLDRAHAALAFASERHLQAERPLPAGFAPLSRFARTRDGHIRLHANYPHHRAALLRALPLQGGCGDPPEDEALAVIATRDAEELETAIVAQGGAAAAVRSGEQWLAHPQGQAVTGLSLLDFEPSDVQAPPLPAGGTLPCDGLRVLDLT